MAPARPHVEVAVRVPQDEPPRPADLEFPEATGVSGKAITRRCRLHPCRLHLDGNRVLPDMPCKHTVALSGLG
jgi:hypothetical protein